MFRATMGPSSGDNNCVYATLGTCYSVSMTVRYTECIRDSHRHKITSTKCRINTVVSPDDGPIVIGDSHPHRITSTKCRINTVVSPDDGPIVIGDSHPHRITSTKCRINTVVSPDVGSIVARNM